MTEKNLNKELEIEVKEDSDILSEVEEIDTLDKEKLDSLTKRLDHMIPDERL